MANTYLDQITTLLAQASPDLSTTHRIEFKNVFGAVGGYTDGRIFISCGKFGVALRLPPEFLATLFQQDDIAPLKYFAKGHIKKEYAVLPRRILEDERQMTELVATSIQFVEH